MIPFVLLSVHFISAVADGVPFAAEKEFLYVGNVLTTATNNFNVHRVKRQVDEDVDFGPNVTRVLQYFRKKQGYDKRIRPNYMGNPVDVSVTLFVSTISSVSEVNMDITLGFYFQQIWHDPRLSFEGIWDEELVISGDYMEEIWRPDTFFVNAKQSFFHEVTWLNTFLRISPSGNVTQSLRLTVTAACPMDFTYFPMDSQRCSLEIESYGYTTRDIILLWGVSRNATKGVGFAPDVFLLPQFNIYGHHERTDEGHLSTGSYSRLILDIHFERRMGYYIIHVYIPAVLIVILSIVSLFISRESPPARISLGITTVLTMETLRSSTNASLPKISYLKAIDVYLVSCNLMVFATLLEYAAVSYTAKQCKMRNCGRNEHVTDDRIGVCAWCRAMNVKASSIEKYSRIAFPTLFATFNFIYWIAYCNASYIPEAEFAEE